MLFIIRCLLVGMLLATPSLAFADFHNALSLQGFTGILNTPNAVTTDENHIYVLYSDQKESQWREKAKQQDNVMFSIGLFDLLEIGGRFFEAPHVGRDLSGNFKVRVPFIPKGEYIPKLAFGIQDVAGGKGARYLQSKYAVASEEIWRFRFSIGYGAGPDRMKGAFGGVELKTCDWLYLLAEDDTKERNVGVRLVTPQIFGYPINLQATAKTSLDHDPGKPEFAVGVQVPLGTEHHYVKPIMPPAATSTASIPAVATGASSAPAEGATPASAVPAGSSSSAKSDKELGRPAASSPAPQAAAATAPAASTSTTPVSATTATSAPATSASLAAGEDQALVAIMKRLAADGFLNVRVGYFQNVLVVEYENARYDHNELDAIGVVTGIVQLLAPERFETLKVVEKKKGIRILQIEMPLKVLRAFFRDASNLSNLRDGMKISRTVTEAAATRYLEGDAKSSYLTASLLVYPGLKTYIGTEVGPFDYLLSVKPDFYLNLWKGSAFNVRADIPVSWSSNFDDRRRFRKDRSDAQVERVMLFQAVKPSGDLLAVLGGGLLYADHYGTANELLWTPGDGSHRFKISQAYATKNDGTDRNEEYLASYRYFYAPLNLYLQGTGGKFITQDKGGLIEVSRFIGDTAVTVFYKNSVAIDGRNHQAVGIQLDVPLTLRRDMKPYPLQLRGTDDFSYAQETSIAKKGQNNYLGTPIGAELQPPFNGDRMFFNRDRLSEPYIKEHLLRLRDAYREYVLPSE